MDLDVVVKVLTAIWLTVQIIAKVKELLDKGNGKDNAKRRK